MAEYIKHDMSHLMDHILEVRYTDVDLEKKLSMELLSWAERECDTYGRAFALTYIGDYYIAVYDAKNAGVYLTQAEQILIGEESWDELRMRVYSLLGIYCEMKADGHNAIEYYLEAVETAARIGDSEGESAALNNLAFLFQRQGCFEEAKQYYEKAYDIQKMLEESPIRVTLLVNLVDISLMLGRYEDAEKYIKECELQEHNSVQRVINRYKNWCSYYAVSGDKNKALSYADKYLEYLDTINQDKMTAFESYHTLCQNMMDLGEKKYTRRFLDAMQAVCTGEELDQAKVMEDMVIRYALRFEPQEKHAAAYHRYYIKNRIFRSKVDESIASAMKSKIRQEQLMAQTERMHSEQENLEREVNLDGLTGLYSRGYLEGLFRKNENVEPGNSLGLVVLDVDYFKEYNDFYGHMKGDTVLQEIADCLKVCSGNNSYPCRYGGDEFVCVCENYSDLEMEAYIKKIREYLHTKAIQHEKSHCGEEITLSIGYALEEVTQVEPHVLFQLADQALYESKRYGRNTYTRKRADVL